MNSKIRFSIGIFLLAAVASVLWYSALDDKHRSPQIPPPTLLASGDHVSIPFQLQHGYVMINGEVLGQRGGFMVDTGTPYPLFLNNAYVALSKEHFVASGHAGGAQGGGGRPQQVYRHFDVGPLRVAHVTLNKLAEIFSSDFSYISDVQNGGLRTDFLGFAGLPLLIDHEFVFDYAAQRLDIYRLDATGNSVLRHFSQNDIVATLRFQRDKPSAPHLPFTTVTIGGVDFEALLDNGTLGDLAITPATRTHLEQNAFLEKSGDIWIIHGLTYNGVALQCDTPLLRDSDRNTMRLGYNLLRHYRSVWNYSRQTVILLKPNTER